MKKFTKILSVIGAAGLALSGLAGCANKPGSGKTGFETELKIGVFNGGLGYEWAEKVAEKFEGKYKDVSFEPGKTGVSVNIDPQKERFKVESIQTAIEQNTGANDIYYTCYLFHRAFANRKLVYNMNDIVNEKVYLDNGELADMTYNPQTKKYEVAAGAESPTKSLLDKMNDPWKTAYYYDSNKTIEAGYYALPYETSLTGFVYDHDLFAEQGWLNYDGIDGLPDTAEDFIDLLERIKRSNMIGYTFSPTDYWMGLQSAYMAQYEGYENAALNYTYSGEYTFKNLPDSTLAVFTDEFCAENNIKNNGDGTYTVTITPSNAWLLAYQPGKDSYLKFLRDITYDSGYSDPNRSKTTYDFTAAQTAFILSKLGKTGQKRIAMLYEGEWWENEARAIFNATGGYGTRDFRFFPLPEIENQKDKNVRSIGSDKLSTDMIINAKSDKLDLCRLWVQFSHSESMLEEMTLTNGVVRNSFEYDLNDAQLSTLTKFGQNVYKIKHGAGEYSKISLVYPSGYTDQNGFYSDTPMGGFGNVISSLCLGKYGTWNAIGTQAIGYFWNRPFDKDNYVSAETFIEEMHNYYSKSTWEQAYRAWQQLNA